MWASPIVGTMPEPAADDSLTDAETLLWTLQQDPWLSSTIATLLICDGPIDHVRLLRTTARAIQAVPRLGERPVAPLGRLSSPRWTTDREFDLGYHVRRIGLGRPADDTGLSEMAGLLELAALLLQDRFDRTRPLWQLLVIEGLANGRTALLLKLDHTLTDGLGAVRLAEYLFDAQPDASRPEPVDLAALLAERAARSTERPRGNTSVNDVGPLAEARRLLGDGLVALSDADALVERASGFLAGLGGLAGRLSGAAGQVDLGQTRLAGSTLWAARSRRRHLLTFELPVAEVKAAGAAANASLNDVFVSGCVLAAQRFHERRGSALERLRVSFAISTRGAESAGGNAFTPCLADIELRSQPAELLSVVRDELRARRAEVGGSGLFATVAGFAKLLPGALTTQMARSQAQMVDFATSNVRGVPQTAYVGAAEIVAAYPVGPVAGMAFNATALSYADTLYVGLHIDPVAVDEPELLLSCLVEAFAQLGVTASTSTARSTRPAAKASKTATAANAANSTRSRRSPTASRPKS